MRRLVLLLLLLLLALPGSSLAQTGGDPAQGDVARGAEIYQASCAMCHGADATGMMGMHPALTGVVSRLTVEGVEVTIRKGRDTRPPMPAFADRLDDTDIADLLAHLDSLPDGPRNFAHEGDGDDQMMDGQGMDGRMNRMMGGGNVALWIVVVILAAALAGVIGYLRASRGSRGLPVHGESTIHPDGDPLTHDERRSDGLLAGALMALGALAVVDNVVFHWWLGFHRFNEAWSHEMNLAAEASLVLTGIAMVFIGGYKTRRVLDR
jgi:mono/diheme cytochrome c family protein